MTQRAQGRSLRQLPRQVEHNLMGRLGSGDAQAFAELWARHEAWVLAYFVKRTGSATDADDLLGDCRLAVLRALPGFAGHQAGTAAPRCSVRTFIGSIAKRLFANWLRRKYRNREVHFTDIPLWEQDLEEGRVATTHPSGGDDDGSDLTIEQVRSAVAGLQSEHQFKAVVFHYFGGCSHEAIATLLNTKSSCINTRLQDARRALKRTLGGLSETSEATDA